MSPNLTPRAKTVIAAFAAVVLTGVTSWQAVTAGGFRWVDVVPVLAAVLGAVQTDLIPNTGDQPVAKAIVHGGFAVASAVSAVIAADPAGFTAAKLLTVAAGAFLVFYVPELAPAAPVLEHAVPVEITDALRALDVTPAVDVTAARPTPAPRAAPPVTTPPAVVLDPATPIADGVAAAVTAPIAAVTT